MRTRRPTRHLFSQDAVSSTENVRLDEALMGVARNPLRDGAPPTGFTFEHLPHFRDAVMHREQVHEALAVLHRASGQQCTTWPRCATCSVLSPNLFDRGRTSGRLRHSSRRCNPSLKDDLVERSPVSPRAARRVTKLSPPSPDAPQGVYRPLRVWSITIWPESKLAESRMTPFSNALGWLSHFRSLHVTVGPNRVEKPQSESRDRDPMRRA
jgi:hypothetical protein